MKKAKTKIKVKTTSRKHAPPKGGPALNEDEQKAVDEAIQRIEMAGPEAVFVRAWAMKFKIGELKGWKPGHLVKELLPKVKEMVKKTVMEAYENAGSPKITEKFPFSIGLSVKEAFLVGLSEGDWTPEVKGGSYFEGSRTMDEVLEEAFEALTAWAGGIAETLDQNRLYKGVLMAKWVWPMAGADGNPEEVDHFDISTLTKKKDAVN